MAWDPILQSSGDPRSQTAEALEPGSGMTLFLAHFVGRPLPDTSVAFRSIASTLRSNNRSDSDSQSIKLAMTSVLEYLKRNLDLLRQAKS